MINPEILISIPQRGLKIFPPIETRENIKAANTLPRARVREVLVWSSQEKARLELLAENPILRKRYPTTSDGKDFMQHVSYDRQRELLGYAREASTLISQSWEDINGEKPITIILFGSVAMGLVKNTLLDSPSNVDIAVIGNFNIQERNTLFDYIRPGRIEIQRKILENCIPSNPKEQNPGNVGVIIQHKDKVTKNNYQGALEYIAANATVLEDSSGLWKEIEEGALNEYLMKKNKRK